MAPVVASTPWARIDGGRRRDPKGPSRRAGVAAAVLALHAVAAYLLASPGLWRAWPTQTPGATLTWLILSQPATKDPESVPQKMLVTPPPSARKLAPPSLAPIKRPSIASPVEPAQDHGAAALRSYVWCGALDDGKQWNGPQRPCDKVHWDLHTGPVAERAPTARENDLARQFERDLAFDKSPKLIPCVYGGISLPCLVQAAMNGFEFKMNSYANVRPPSSTCATRFEGEHCARIYSLHATAPTALHR
jgi:hypothetical protein